MKVKQVKSRLK